MRYRTCMPYQPHHPKRSVPTLPTLTIGQFREWMHTYRVTVKEIGRLLGVGHGTPYNWMRGADTDPIEQRMVCAAIIYCLLTGTPCCVEIAVVGRAVAEDLAVGFRSLDRPAKERELRDAHAILRARQIATELLADRP